MCNSVLPSKARAREMHDRDTPVKKATDREEIGQDSAKTPTSILQAARSSKCDKLHECPDADIYDTTKTCAALSGGTWGLVPSKQHAKVYRKCKGGTAWTYKEKLAECYKSWTTSNVIAWHAGKCYVFEKACAAVIVKERTDPENAVEDETYVLYTKP
jgi:hypothetical protein